jgi:hypothetical protein
MSFVELVGLTMMIAVLTVGTMVETAARVRKGNEPLFMIAVMVSGCACVRNTWGMTTGAHFCWSPLTGNRGVASTAGSGKGKVDVEKGEFLADICRFGRRISPWALPFPSNLALKFRMWSLPSPLKSGSEDHFLQPPWPGERPAFRFLGSKLCGGPAGPAKVDAAGSLEFDGGHARPMAAEEDGGAT